jgi:CDP-diacylglycerol--glycerol-3-phosphate 3-phosphatidyltransferase
MKAEALETLLCFPSNTVLQSTWLCTVGYFNPTPRFTLLPLNIRCSGPALTTTTQANSFFNLSGISNLIPAAYTMLLLYFLRAVMFAGRSSEVTPRDRQRGITSKPGGWTYHAKGLWVTGEGEVTPGLTMGSSNCTKRS